MPLDRFQITKVAAAKVLIFSTYVSTRQVVDRGVYLTQAQARRYLRELVKLGWMEERRVPSVGKCYFPTDIGRLGLAPLVDEPLKAPDA